MMIGWLDRILEYKFDVVHLPGLDNILPDQLSRLFPMAKELGGDDNEEIIVRAANANDADNDFDEMFEPPEGERENLLIKYHLFGHFGAAAIVKALHSDGIHWPNVHKDAVQVVKQCNECQMSNIVKKGYHPLRSIHSFLPADHWAIDLAGPFRPTHDSNTYLLVMVDVCTRYCVLRPLPNKQSDTIVKTLIQVFGDYGFPRYLQSDNGTEFVNQLVKKLAQATGFDHRLATPYHPRANGVAERWVQTSNRDRCESNDCKRVTREIGSNGERGFPAINEKVLAMLEAGNKAFNDKHYIVDFPINSQVVVIVPENERSKLDTPHDGPFTVVRKTRGGSYVLKDIRGKLLGRDYAPSQLKLISQDYDLPCDDIYVVDRIVAHERVAPGKYKYLLTTSMRSISNQKKEDVKHLLQQGTPYRKISELTGVSLGAIGAVRKDLNVDIEPNGAGRKRIMSSNDIRVVIRKLVTGEYKSVEDASRQLRATYPNKVTPSAETIRREMKRLNYVAMKKPNVLPLTRSRRNARFRFAQAYRSWTVEDWKRVVFTDETKVNRLGSDGLHWTWIDPDGKLRERNVIHTYKHGGGSIMIWGCFCWSGPGNHWNITALR
ncbi:hypothetical protein RO3G_08665 [Lichtheimia corymbifera JMRC:FSU:9682]|uniref:Integrase catalytic domain-containing protein n=1 Tax=Lichtheimia corymbifera JMRC:FSU:9682 TaxID=1263082 RepID=A0A068SGK7_9FUNG|nr:hypothetical protein RO3G_08665 [Lichtheimia corymbifera JMRC:FSU:9682]